MVGVFSCPYKIHINVITNNGIPARVTTDNPTYLNLTVLDQEICILLPIIMAYGPTSDGSNNYINQKKKKEEKGYPIRNKHMELWTTCNIDIFCIF